MLEVSIIVLPGSAITGFLSNGSEKIKPEGTKNNRQKL
jgi:hypothetical protein